MGERSSEAIRANALRLYRAMSDEERLAFLAAVYNRITVRVRGEYQEIKSRHPDVFPLFRAINELHHQLSNHLSQVTAGYPGYGDEGLFSAMLEATGASYSSLVLQPLVGEMDRRSGGSFSIIQGVYRTQRITGPTHNFLGIRFAESPADAELIPIWDRLPRNLDPAQIRAAVLAAVTNFESEAGRRFHVAAIENAPDDTPPESIYVMMAESIIRRIHGGAGFRKIDQRFWRNDDSYVLTITHQHVRHVIEGPGYRLEPTDDPIVSTLGLAVSDAPIGPPEVVLLDGSASASHLDAIRRDALQAASLFREKTGRRLYVERVDFGLSVLGADPIEWGTFDFVRKILERLHEGAPFEDP